MFKEKKPDFKFFVPLDVDEIQKATSKNGKYKDFIVSGMASDNTEDTDKEYLIPSGFVLDRFLKNGWINWDHRKDPKNSMIGEPIEAKVVDNKFHIKGRLFGASSVARDVVDTMEMLKKSDSKKRMGWSIEGKALERHPQNQKRITKALITGIAITANPKNGNTYADIVKGNYSDPLPNYTYEDENLEKAIQSTNGGIAYLVDITNPKNGMRYTIDKDLNLKVEKAMDTTTAQPLIKESLEGKKKKDAIINLANATMTGAISKSLFNQATKNYKMSISDKNYNIIRKAFIEGKVDFDILEKAKAKNLQSKHAGSNWITMNGAKVLIGGDGKVIAGAGGKFSGEGKKESDKKVNHSIKEGDTWKDEYGDTFKVIKVEGDNIRYKKNNQEGIPFSGHYNMVINKQKQAQRGLEKKEKEAIQKKDYENIDGFGESLSPKQKGQVLKTLNAIGKYDGKLMKRKDFIKEKIKEGYVNNKNGDLQKDSSIWRNTGKISIQYSEHLLSQKKEGVSDKKESGKKELYHKDDKLNEFRDIAANSKDMGEFFTKVRAVKNVPPDVSQQFSDKYNPNENLSMESSAKKMFNEVKGGNKGEKKIDISHIDFNHYKPLEESLKESAGKDNYFVPKEAKKKEQWMKDKKEKYISGVKKDLDKGVFEEAVKQKKLTPNQVSKIVESAGLKKEVKSSEKKEIPKEVTKKINDMKDLNNAAKKLDSAGIYDNKTGETKPDVLKNMLDTAKKIDTKKLSSKTKEKLEKFLEELDVSVWLHEEPKENKKIGGVNNLQLDFQNKDTLSEKIDFINERLQYEEKTKEKEGLSYSKFEQKYGSLYGHEDMLDDAKDLIVEMSKEYVKKETTEVLQHKLF